MKPKEFESICKAITDDIIIFVYDICEKLLGFYFSGVVDG